MSPDEYLRSVMSEGNKEVMMFNLDQQRLEILSALAHEPLRFVQLVAVCEITDAGIEDFRKMIAELVTKKLAWLNVAEAIFMITHTGMANMKAHGRRAMKFSTIVPKVQNPKLTLE